MYIFGKCVSQITTLSNLHIKLVQSKNVLLYYKQAANFTTQPRNCTKAIIKIVENGTSRSLNADSNHKNCDIEENILKAINSGKSYQKGSILRLNQISRYYSKSCKDVKGGKSDGDGTDGDDSNNATLKQLRYNYHKNVEDAINKQIVREFTAAYSYLAMACYFGKTSVALPGIEKFFMTMYDEEVAHALAFIKYQQMRGGVVKLAPIPTGECAEGCNIKKSLELALDLEIKISDKILEIYAIAEQHEDIRTIDFLTTEFITEQMQSIRTIGALLIQANKMGDTGLAEFLLDKQFETARGHTETHKPAK